MAAVKEDHVRRGLVFMVLCATALLAVPASAAAGDAFVPPGSPTIIYSADPGETNDIEIAAGGIGVAFTEQDGAATLTAGVNCNQTGPKQVQCPLSHMLGPVPIPAVQISVVLGDAADELLVTSSPLFLFANGGVGADRLEGRVGLQQLSGDAGDDTLVSTGGDAMIGGDNFDTVDLSARATPIVIGGGGATDGVTTVERVIGGTGNDLFRLTSAAEEIVGGPGIDRIGYDDRGADQPVTADSDGLADDGVAAEGDNIDPTVENITGGAGNDLLGGFAGVANVLDGGAGIDTATYAGRADAIVANLDDLAGDGATSENDHLIGFESLTGGEGSDFLTGSPGPNALTGGGGNDVLDGGDGADALSGEAGNDQLTGGSGVDGYAGGEGDDNLTAFDGLAEGVDCGGGTDNAAVDVADTLANCETVRKLDEVLDVDRDGSLPPQDCNDTNAAIKPGATDIPKNGIDEDCSGKDASFGRVRSTVRNAWAFNNVFARATKFAVKDVPAGGVVRLKCTPPKGKKKACPFKSRTRESVNGTKNMNLLKSFKKRKLPVGTVIEVKISKKNTIARVVRFTTRSGKVPKAKTLCQAPGKKKPGKC